MTPNPIHPMFIPYDVDCRTEVEVPDEKIRECKSEIELRALVYSMAEADAPQQLAVRIESYYLEDAIRMMNESK